MKDDSILQRLSHKEPKNMRWLQTLQAGFRVKRMHVVPTLKDHTVGEHTAHSLAYVVHLARLNPSVRLDRCMLHTLQHDVAEQYTGDMPANVKMENPGLRAALMAVEHRWEDAHVLPDYIGGFEHLLCKMADWLQLQEHCIHERSMGNRQVEPVYRNITAYIQAHKAFSEVVGAMSCWQENARRWHDITSQ